MRRAICRILAPVALLAALPSAFAIHVESDHPDLQRPQARLLEAARAAESTINGGTTSISSSGFTGMSDQGIKRKPFPPGFGRTGYEFEDEVLRAAPAEPRTGEPAAQAASPAPAPKR